MIEHYLGADVVPRRRAALHGAASRGQRGRRRPVARARRGVGQPTWRGSRRRGSRSRASRWSRWRATASAAPRPPGALLRRSEGAGREAPPALAGAAGRAGRRRRRRRRLLADKASQDSGAAPRGRRAVVLRQRGRGRLLSRAARRRRRWPRCVADARQRSTPVERLALAGDQWALVRADARRVESFLDLADALGGEPDHDVLDGVAGAAGGDRRAGARSPAAPCRTRCAAWIAARFGPAFARLGWTRGAGRGRRRAAASRGAAAARRRRRRGARGAGGGAPPPRRLPRRPRIARAQPRRPGGRRSRRASATRRCYDRYRGGRRGGAHAAGAAPVPARAWRRSARRATIRPHARRDAHARDPDAGRRLPADAAVSAIPPGGEEAWTLPAPEVDRRSASAFRRSCSRAWSRRRRRCATPRHAREVRGVLPRPSGAGGRARLRQALEVFRLNAELRRRTAKPLARWLARQSG